ncbi:CHAT domain-containing protein [Sphingobium lignivorans]|uniref:CHAT domain-containing protein n=1 Tax=Sphingobium lignivorans TaxID=2735886 RepID=A0ABR6NH36_9SPHN|nr:CHAT domain-containing protein [Sphingobium lignivorans]MBB5986598.1 hypothetical protein [Sphingobium lignivorans]
MRILYVASQTDESETLALEREITDVQRQLSQTSLRAADIEFLPDITIEALPIELSRTKPDLLHISVHGEREGLWFAKEAFRGQPKQFVRLAAERLYAFLDPDKPPKLVFLNACNSHQVAEVLAERGIAAIGTSAPITNHAAAAASRLLYERLLGGRSIAEAFEAVNALAQTIDDDRVKLHLFMPAGLDAGTLALHRVVKLAARLSSEAVVKPGKPVAIQLGVIGCPAETSQVVFFTDDLTFISQNNKSTLEEDLCEVIRDNPRRGEIWTEVDWRADGDFRGAACGITAAGRTFAVSGMLIDALESYARMSSPSPEYLDLLAQAVDLLRTYDGAGLASWQKAKPKTA